ncbi:isopentenyl phosphate kinase [Haloglomus litoreum]|uniref:isopentenyl phosphate kinase n=1 Tax=Haloglomus litoreum TaxID=3034026 RepID=UPI0023E8657C|nr:isopentenyl phosphate kinase [Haloglomus sp. DT116]
MTTVLKLGGSVVTRKDAVETVDTERLARAAAAVGAVHGREAPDDAADAVPAPAELVVVHGGGSFGHPNAERHGVTTSAGSHDATAVREIHGAMRELNRAVVGALADAGVPAVPVAPLSTGFRVGGAFHQPADAVAALLAEGFVPVLHGDVVATAGEGVTVVSGDELVTELATGLDADRVGLCSDVPGVLDTEGEVVDRVTAIDEVADALGGSDATDVTGGMAAKVRTLLDLDAPASVFDLDGLDAFLTGESPGTLVAGGPSGDEGV